MKRKKKFFDGGVKYDVMNSLSSTSNLVSNAMSGDVGSILDASINTAKQSYDILNSDLSGGAKIASVLGTLVGGPAIGGVVNSLVGAKLQNRRDGMASDNADIQQRNQMFGFADGGNLTYFDGGFRHNEQNPLNTMQGIPQGETEDGIMNTVERGEVKQSLKPGEDWIYSDKQTVPDKLEKTNLPKNIVGMTYADAVKYIDKFTKDDYKYDKIAKETKETLLTQLRGIEEAELAEQAVTAFARLGGRILHAEGGMMPMANNTIPLNIDPNVMAMQRPYNPLMEGVQSRVDLLENEGNNMDLKRMGSINPNTLKQFREWWPNEQLVTLGNGDIQSVRETQLPLSEEGYYDKQAGSVLSFPTQKSVERYGVKQVMVPPKGFRPTMDMPEYEYFFEQNYPQEFIQYKLKKGTSEPENLDVDKANGGSIHIDPSKKGTFKAQASKMGMGVQEAASKILNAPEGTYSPAMRRKANFAKNFAHELGGTLQHETNPYLNTSKSTYNFGSGEQNTLFPYEGYVSGPSAIPNLVPNYLVDNDAPNNQSVNLNNQITNENDNTSDNKINYFNYQNIFDPNMTSTDSIRRSQDFVKDWTPYIGNATLGKKNVPMQSINGAYAGNVTAKNIMDTDPEYIESIFGKDNFKGTPEQISQLQRTIEKNPERYAQVKLRPGDVNKNGKDIYSPWGADWMNALTYKPIIRDRLNPMTGITPSLEVPNFDGKLVPIPPKNPPKEQDKDKPKDPLENPNLWPEAGLASQLLPMAMLKNKEAVPTTISSGWLKPQLTDEMTMRNAIESSNRGNIGALANVTGGSAAAQRAGLLGAGSSAMDAISNAYIQSNQMNNQARMGADQFNIQNQGNIAGINQDALNRFNLFNTDNANQLAMEKAGGIAQALGQYTMNGYNRRKEADQRDMWAKLEGYDPKTLKYMMDNGFTPEQMAAITPKTVQSCKGGKINRKLK